MASLWRFLFIFTATFFLSVAATTLLAGSALAEEKNAIVANVGKSNFQSVNDLDDSEFEISSSGNEQKIHDPLEKYNRKIHSFNNHFDRYLFRPAANAYRNTLPDAVRKSIRNFITNLYLPISATNSLLQGKVDNSLATFSHFLINSTIGVAGLFDIASKKQIRYNHEDFGQTLGHYQLSSGTYLVLPFLGPSSLRDFSGMIVDKSVNPLDFALVKFNGQNELIPSEYRIALSTINAIDKRESFLGLIDDINSESFDPYATIRSAYLQKRLNDINN